MSSKKIARLDSNGEQVVTHKELSRLTGENYSTIQHWTREGLLKFSRKGRTRYYPGDENLKRVRYIRKEQSKAELTTLSDIQEGIKAGLHSA